MEKYNEDIARKISSLAISGREITREAFRDRTNSSSNKNKNISLSYSQKKKPTKKKLSTPTKEATLSAKEHNIMNLDTPKKSNVSPMTSVLLPSRAAKSSPEAQQVHWVGMTPLDWIESLKAKTAGPNAMEAWTAGGGTKDGLTQFGQNKNTTTPMKSSIVPETPFSTPSSVTSMQVSSTPTSTPATPMDIDGDTTMVTPTITTTTDSPLNITQMPLYWDFSYLQRTPLTERLRVLVLAVETHPSFSQVRLAYHRTLNHFKYSVWYIRSYDSHPVAQLDRLYYETIHKVEVMLELAQRLATPPPIPPTVESEMMTTEAPPTPPPVETGVQHKAVTHTPSSSPSSTIKIGKYMTKWLRDNWINPYPDERVFQTLANDCETTPHIIANWLVNARSRRWRPAMTQALELNNRPASMLLEDSLNIFDGKPLRDLDGHAGPSC